MLQLLLDLSDQFFALLIDGVLGVEQLTALHVATAFKIAQLLLVDQLVLQ